MPDPQRRYTKLEIAEQLRLLAKHADGAAQSKLLSLAAMYEHETDLVSWSQRAIIQSRALIAKVEKLLPP